MKEKICAIVVTYNRKELLLKQINNILKKQTCEVDTYYIIDNCSTDDTENAVYECMTNLNTSKINYCKTNYNSGGAGGFSFGLQKAYETGYDWYIMMDDDGRPYDEKCIENLLSYIEKKGYSSKNAYLLNSLVQSDDKYLSFGLDHLEKVEDALRINNDGAISGKINPFNGTWISHGLIEKIGFPNGDFFIKGDENDYIRRAQSVNAVIQTIVDSRYYHPRSIGYKKKKVLGHDMYVYIEAPWKEYYSARNYTFSYLQFLDHKGALMFCAKRIYCAMVCKCKKIDTVKMIVKGYIDGKKGRLGATIRP